MQRSRILPRADYRLHCPGISLAQIMVYHLYNNPQSVIIWIRLSGNHHKAEDPGMCRIFMRMRSGPNLWDSSQGSGKVYE